MHCARAVAASGAHWHVLIAGRDQRKSLRAVSAIASASGNPTVEAMALDLGALESVREFANAFAARGLPPLRALVCNAGVQLARIGPRTADGYELTFGVNHLGHFLLVHLLLGRLVAPARIVVVSSASHDPARRTGMPPPRDADAMRLAHPELDPLLDSGPGLAARRAYATSKLCNLLFVHELCRRLERSGRSTARAPITVNAFDPGFMPATDLGRAHGLLARALFGGLLAPLARVMPGMSTPERAGSQLAAMLLDPALERVSGRYFAGAGQQMPSLQARDGDSALRLWRASSALAGLRPEDEQP
ncbi:MAG: SDR family NAD(P)-dependent oxidoreductase [Gammaproteobacteria bacterium]|nr:SDR family NAD(P)-dependent oxidoreductase [Gammaproteobacteria bacterium]